MLIQQIKLQTASLFELALFYERTLGLPVQENPGDNIVIVMGQSKLVFTTASIGKPFYHFAINVPSNKIDEAKAWLKDKVQLLWMEDYKSEIADFVNWHAKSVYFFDPAGNIVELISRFDLENPSEAPFGAGHFLSISEIGLVLPAQKFDDETRLLMERYKLSFFNKQPPLPQFKAIGDDEGLFIIVPRYRNWYPTTRPSDLFPMEINFQQGNGEYLLTL